MRHMKVIINGRKYDTETARLLGKVMNENASIGCPVFDELYRKKTGEFFRYLWREFYGSEIVPLTEQEAREWMEDHSSVELYEEIFGEVEE